MTQINFKSAGVSARVINLTGPTAIQPLGVPAGVIGTAQKGPAFVPVTTPTRSDFTVAFGLPQDDRANGPLAVSEWLRNQQAATFVRLLGVGKGLKRDTTGDNKGRVEGAGFVVGAEQPQVGGILKFNPKANAFGPPGRLYFLNTFMSESTDSNIFTDAGLNGSAVPIVRAVIMAASGVVPHLSASTSTDNGSDAPAPTLIASGGLEGALTGSVNLNGGRQEFVLLLNGHKGTDKQFPNVLTASFDPDAPNYLRQQLNTDPLRLEDAGHLLYADYAIHPQFAVPTGSNVIKTSSLDVSNGLEPVAFLVTGSAARNSGSTTAPSYENWEDRFETAHSTWVVSQKFGGKPENLFQIYSLDDGIWPNDKIKWSIENITPSNNDVEPYGTFDLLVRRFDDSDKNREVLEAWRGLSLNPNSQNYIARKIGDQHTFYNFDANESSQKLVTEGVYPVQSNYIRVKVSEKVENAEVDEGALPMGFRGPAHLVTSGSDPLANINELHNTDSYVSSALSASQDVVQMPVPYRQHIAVGSPTNRTADRGLYWGVQFERRVNRQQPNSTTQPNRSILGFTKFFPNFQTEWRNVVVEGNEGAQDTPENGILDSDRFNNNKFTLENIAVTTGSSNAADVTTLTSWRYIRNGSAPQGSRSLAVSDLSDPSVRQVAKFNGLVHGGFDGVRIFDKDTLNLTNTAIEEEMNNPGRGVSEGATVTAYQKGLDLMADETEVDIQLLTIPGIRHPIITDKALQTTEELFDALYIMDIEEYDTSNFIVTASGDQIESVRFTANQFRNRGINSSFGAAYYPDVVLRDDLNDTVREVPPSVAVLGAFGLNDSVGHPWFAPAGFARGALETTEEATVPLSRQNMDSLQEVDINPIVSFAGSEGPVVWGQKTLLARDSALERVNVRRLLINLRRDIRRIARRFVFEPNREETLARFSALVNPVLKRVQDQRGLDRFLVRIDTTTTTQADVENGVIRGQIFLVPTRTLEFLSIDFAVTNQGNFSSNT